jgi:hypothetical protein
VHSEGDSTSEEILLKSRAWKTNKLQKSKRLLKEKNNSRTQPNFMLSKMQKKRRKKAKKKPNPKGSKTKESSLSVKFKTCLTTQMKSSICLKRSIMENRILTF